MKCAKKRLCLKFMPLLHRCLFRTRFSILPTAPYPSEDDPKWPLGIRKLPLGSQDFLSPQWPVVAGSSRLRAPVVKQRNSKGSYPAANLLGPVSASSPWRDLAFSNADVPQSTNLCGATERWAAALGKICESQPTDIARSQFSVTTLQPSCSAHSCCFWSPVVTLQRRTRCRSPSRP